MPKLAPFALAPAGPPRSRPYYLLIFFLLFAAPLLLLHQSLLSLPFFWDEQGQFIPTALDLLRDGSWVAHSTLPNIHPPGVEAYLVLWYKLFGYSIPVTRSAMLFLAGLGLLGTFLLAIELSQRTEGAPAFIPPLFLLASPLFYTQSMLAQLDMPAMVMTVFALLFFIRKQYLWSAAICVLLVLAKESGLATPFVFFLSLLWRRDWKNASLFIAPALALGAWLLMLHNATHFWFGNPGFQHYNVSYSLHPVRLAFSFCRRLYYLFFAEFRWIAALALIVACRRAKPFDSDPWRIAIAVSAANFLLVTVLGGAELERYLLPVLPVFYIAVSVALTFLGGVPGIISAAALVIGLTVSLFWNPPYPFPYENNLAMVDFVRLQQSASSFVEYHFAGKTIATAWPYTASLANPDYGFVKHKFRVIETNDFHLHSIESLSGYDVLITYTRTWTPPNGVIQIAAVRSFLARFYDWAPDITAAQCEALSLFPVMSLHSRGQETTIYSHEPSAIHKPAQILLRSRENPINDPSPRIWSGSFKVLTSVPGL